MEKTTTQSFASEYNDSSIIASDRKALYRSQPKTERDCFDRNNEENSVICSDAE